MYFPKRLLLSFLVVLAFPKAFEKDGGCVQRLPPVAVWGSAVPYLHDGVGGQHPLLHAGLFRGAADGGKVAHGVLGRDGFPGARVAAHDDRLVLSSLCQEKTGKTDWIGIQRRLLSMQTADANLSICL